VPGEDKGNPYICSPCRVCDKMSLGNRKRIKSVVARLHAPVDTGGVDLDDRKPGDLCVGGSEVAHRIRCDGIAGEREGA
jgi:hypothetical protein